MNVAKPLKVEVKLGFVRWRPMGEREDVTLAATEAEMNVSSQLDAVISIDKDKLYELLRSEKEQARQPVFVLTIPD